MPVLEEIVPKVRDQIAAMGGVQVVVALPGVSTADSLAAALRELRPLLSKLLPDGRYAVIHPDAVPLEPPEGESAVLIPCPLTPVNRFQPETFDAGFRPLFTVSQGLSAQVGVIVGSASPRDVASDAVALLEPVLHNGYDLAIPLYARGKFDGLINAAILSPFVRALFGMRLQFPMATDFAVSPKLASLYSTPSTPGASHAQWIATRAITSGMQIAQVQRGAVPPPSAASNDVSTVLADILHALFAETERTASYWQRVRGSQPARVFGSPVEVADETGGDVTGMLEAFQRGCRDLSEIWTQFFSPAAIVELKKLSRQTPETFRITDELWAQLIYDAAIGYRKRVMNRDHLLRAMTPVYLGWVASYALAVRDMAPDAVQERLDRLCLAFETLKPRLLSQWRWPDRFNP